MAVSRKTFQDTFSHLWARLSGQDRTLPFTSEELSLRSELFSADQMERRGKNLAADHPLQPEHPRNPLLTRLDENAHFLTEVHRLLTEDVQAARRITPAGEWVLDNI